MTDTRCERCDVIHTPELDRQGMCLAQLGGDSLLLPARGYKFPRFRHTMHWMMDVMNRTTLVPGKAGGTSS